MTEETPWLDAPTHDGLWWVWDGLSAPALCEIVRAGDEWWERQVMHAGYGRRPVHPTWQYAPAVPPAPPVPR